MDKTLLAYYGQGKGKTTAALGCVVRALGRDQRVLLVQFIKRPGVSGEHRSLAGCPGLVFQAAGRGFIRPGAQPAEKQRHLAAALKGLEFACREFEKDPADLIVLDEILHVFNIFPEMKQPVLDFLKRAIAESAVIVTGTTLPGEINRLATSVYRIEDERKPEKLPCAAGLHF